MTAVNSQSKLLETSLTNNFESESNSQKDDKLQNVSKRALEEISNDITQKKQKLPEKKKVQFKDEPTIFFTNIIDAEEVDSEETDEEDWSEQREPTVFSGLKVDDDDFKSCTFSTLNTFMKNEWVAVKISEDWAYTQVKAKSIVVKCSSNSFKQFKNTSYLRKFCSHDYVNINESHLDKIVQEEHLRNCEIDSKDFEIDEYVAVLRSDNSWKYGKLLKFQYAVDIQSEKAFFNAEELGKFSRFVLYSIFKNAGN